MRKSFEQDAQAFTVEVQKQGGGFYTGISEDGKGDSNLAVSEFRMVGTDGFVGTSPRGRFEGRFLYADGVFYIHMNGRVHRIREADAQGAEAGGSGRYKSPMPGKVIAVNVEAGQNVEVDQTLVVVEAMKMENAIKAGQAGTVKAVNCAAGDLIQPEDVLVEVESASV